jgi:hypothetical protein
MRSDTVSRSVPAASRYAYLCTIGWQCGPLHAHLTRQRRQRLCWETCTCTVHRLWQTVQPPQTGPTPATSTSATGPTLPRWPQIPMTSPSPSTPSGCCSADAWSSSCTAGSHCWKSAASPCATPRCAPRHFAPVKSHRTQRPASAADARAPRTCPSGVR